MPPEGSPQEEAAESPAQESQEQQDPGNPVDMIKQLFLDMNNLGHALKDGGIPDQALQPLRQIMQGFQKWVAGTIEPILKGGQPAGQAPNQPSPMETAGAKAQPLGPGA